MFNFWNNSNANQANSQAIPISKTPTKVYQYPFQKDIPKKPDGYKSINSSSIVVGNFNTCQSSQKQFYHSSSHY
jgi:hypothetical protein